MFVLVSNKWSNYLNANLEFLRSEGLLCDVTLAGNDGHNQLAHSSMLAAASNVLKSCLVQAPRGHYVVKIPSISGQVWELLMHFIYQGRVRVTPDQRAELLNASQTLGLGELQGLLKACTESEVGAVATTSSAEGQQSEVNTMGTDPVQGKHEPDMGDSIVLNDQDVSAMKLEQDNKEKPMTDEKHVSNSKATRYTCTLCGKSFPWGKSLHIHELMHKQKKTSKHQCSICSKLFSSYHSLRAHERTHSFHPYKCEECRAGFHFHVNYELHMWKEHQKQVSGGVYTCKHCSKTFVAKGLLQRHLSQIHGLRKEKVAPGVNKKSVKAGSVCVCGICEATFMSRLLLKEHFLSEHQVANPEFCDICEYGCETSEGISQHYQIHLGKRTTKSEEAAAAVGALTNDPTEETLQYKCEVCHMVCKSMRLLAKHMRTHEGQVSEELWRCPVCSDEFDNKPDFSMHIAQHRGEKTYNCKYCAKGFTHKGNYSTHVQRHLGIKPYACKFCPKSFVRKDDMKSHMRVHTGEKPYSCQVCKMKYSCISNLREHERAKHNVSFSKRNPNVVVPRQHRPKVKYRSKNVAQFDITQVSEDLLRLGVLQEVGETETSPVQQVLPDSDTMHRTDTIHHTDTIHPADTIHPTDTIHHAGTIQHTDTIQQSPTAEGQLDTQLIMREGEQGEYYQVIEAEDGIQTLAPILQLDQKGTGQITFAIDGSHIAKMEGDNIISLGMESGENVGGEEQQQREMVEHMEQAACDDVGLKEQI